MDHQIGKYYSSLQDPHPPLSTAASSPLEQRKSPSHSQKYFDLDQLSDGGDGEDGRFALSALDQDMREGGGPLIYFFANPGSGSRKARFITRKPYECVRTEKGLVRVINVLQKEAVARAYSEIKAAQEFVEDYGKNVKFVMCGGDGTFMRCIRDMLVAGIDVNNGIEFCLLPFGTGNDFARAFGWGADMPEALLNVERLSERVRECEPSKVDIWDVTVELRPGGAIHQIGPGGAKVEVASVMLKKLMVNYFSVGVDAQIGMGFDKHRTHNRICNRCVYTWEGAKKLLFHRNRSMRDIIHHLKSQDKTVMATDPQTPAEAYLRGNPIAFVCTNIPCYMGGMATPWRANKRLSALQDDKGQAMQDQWTGQEQDCSDGKLEFSVAYSIVGLISEQWYRVAQAGGPLELKFQEPQDEELVTYMNIDGEFYRVINPSRVVVRASSGVAEGQVAVLGRTT